MVTTIMVSQLTLRKFCSHSLPFSVIVALVCELPTDYPTSEAPILNIEVVKGLSMDRGEELKQFADKIAVENIGLPSIFTVAEGVKEWLVDNNIPGQDGSMYSGGQSTVKNQ